MHSLVLFVFLTFVAVVNSQSELKNEIEIDKEECKIFPPLLQRLFYLARPTILARITRPFSTQVTFGSESMFQRYAKTFLGRPAKDQKELDDMCLSIMCTGVFCTESGYKDKVYLTMGRAKSPFVYKFGAPLAASPGVVTVPYEDTLAWANPDHFLFVGCAEGTGPYWKLMSLTPPSTEVKSHSLNVVERLGFNQSAVMDLSSHCSSTVPTVREMTLMAMTNLNIVATRRKRGPGKEGEETTKKTQVEPKELSNQITLLSNKFATIGDYYENLIEPTTRFNPMGWMVRAMDVIFNQHLGISNYFGFLCS